MIKVGVNGYGVIGKRLADAVNRQADLELVGITARTPDYRLIPAQQKGISIFGTDQEQVNILRQNNIDVQGDLSDLLSRIDIILDATPKGIGAKNKKIYEKHDVKSIYQGGEKHELTGLSFVAQVNYDQAIDADSTRIVSCNTTAISRILHPFQQRKLLSDAFVVINRRAADPVDAHRKGPLGTINIGRIPSHHGEDVLTVIPKIRINTVAQEVPTTIGHIHTMRLELNNNLSKNEIIDLLLNTPRVKSIYYDQGLTSQNQVAELMRDLGNSRGDMYNVAFWADTLQVIDNILVMNYQVHNEAIVIPENIDAIRALTGLSNTADKSMSKTDQYLV